MSEAETWIATGDALAAALSRVADGRVRSSLAECGLLLVRARRFEEALQVHDAIVEFLDLDLSAYCNALWVVQEDNTKLPKDAVRARRYLHACLPHAGRNPAIRLNAAGVLAELGDDEEAISQLVLAAHDGYDVRPFLGEALFAPLTRHARWREVVAAAAPPARGFSDVLREVGIELPSIEHPFDDWIWSRQDEVCEAVAPDRMVTALLRALDDDDARNRQAAVRLLLWWLHEDGDDGHGGGPPDWLATWYQAIGEEIAARVPAVRLAEIIARDLRGPYVRTAARNLTILGRVHRFSDDAAAIVDVLSPVMAELLRTGDWPIRDDVADALWSHAHAASPRLRRDCLPAVLALFEELTAADPARGLGASQRDFLFHAAMALHELAGPEVGPIAARLGERWWRTLADTPAMSAVVELLGIVRAPGARSLLEDILRDRPGSQAWARAMSAIGWLHDPRAIDALLAARRVIPPSWSESMTALPRRRAALSLLQLGSLAGADDILASLRRDPTSHGLELTEILDPLVDAASRPRAGVGGDDAWRTFASQLVEALRALVEHHAADHVRARATLLVASLRRAVEAWRPLAVP